MTLKDDSAKIKLEPSWKAALEGEFSKEYFAKLSDFVRAEYTHAAVYPPPKDIFRAFDLTPFSDVEVVILGQDPYHGPGKTGDLERWATQGVLLLNATLTVRARTAGSHQGKGWEAFTDAVVRALSDKKEHLVFMLWGNYAKQKGAHIDRAKHLVLESAHPSPFAAHNGFFGNGHFKAANEYLVAHGKHPINWL